MRGQLLSLSLGSALVAECVKQWARGGLSAWPALLGLSGAFFLKTHRLLGNLLLAAVGSFCVAISLPTTANHVFALSFALWACAAGSWVRKKRLEPMLLAPPEQLVRWLGFSVLLWSGLQKLLHGTYWQGEFLATKLARGEARWRWFESLVHPTELATLRGAHFAGPFRFTESPLAVWASRSVPLLEITLALGLLSPRTAPFAVTAALFLLASFQSVATEMTFALTMLAILGSFVRLRAELALARVSWVCAALLGVAAWRMPGLFN